MQRTLGIFLIVLGASVMHAQDRQDPLDRNAAVQKAWAIVTAALNAPNLQEQVAAVSALSAAEMY